MQRAVRKYLRPSRRAMPKRPHYSSPTAGFNRRSSAASRYANYINKVTAASSGCGTHRARRPGQRRRAHAGGRLLSCLRLAAEGLLQSILQCADVFNFDPTTGHIASIVLVYDTHLRFATSSKTSTLNLRCGGAPSPPVRRRDYGFGSRVPRRFVVRLPVAPGAAPASRYLPAQLRRCAGRNGAKLHSMAAQIRFRSSAHATRAPHASCAGVRRGAAAAADIRAPASSDRRAYSAINSGVPSNRIRAVANCGMPQFALATKMAVGSEAVARFTMHATNSDAPCRNCCHTRQVHTCGAGRRVRPR